MIHTKTTSTFMIVSFLILCAGSASAATSLTLAWDPSPSSGVTGYVMSWGTRSGVYTSTLDVGNALSAPVPGLADGTTYYFAVQAYNADFALSAYSNEVSGQTSTPTTPLAVTCNAPTAASPDGNPVGVQIVMSVTGGTAPYTKTCSPASPYPVGSTPVMCTATDMLKATASCNTVVVVTGPPPAAPTPPLTITCPQLKAYSTDGQAIPLTYAPTVSGGVNPLNVTCTPPSGSSFAVGTTTLTCKVTDAVGQTATCSASEVVSGPSSSGPSSRKHGRKWQQQSLQRH